MKKTLIAVLVILFAVQLLAMSDDQPQRIVLSWQGDPTTSQSVAWRTVKHLDNAEAQVAPVMVWGRQFKDAATTVKAVAEDITTIDGNTFTHYNARFDGLKPNSSYVYRVGAGETWSEWNVFHTAGNEEEPFSFIYLGDIQNDIYSHASPLLRTAYADAPDSRFVLIAGDLVNRGNNDDNWREFFEAFGFIARTVPFVPAPGNHDTTDKVQDDDGNETPDPLYFAHFALPTNGPDNKYFKEAAYTIDYQSARFVIFNSDSWENKDQLEWLESVLKSNTKEWLIVTFHHPIYSTGNERDNKEQRAVLAPLFEKYGVDLVLSGHDHHYGRTGKIIQDKTVGSDVSAPIYAVSVSGPKMYKDNKTFAHLMRTDIGETQLYQVISLCPKKLTYVSKSLDGKVMDSFTLFKQGDGTVLVEGLN